MSDKLDQLAEQLNKNAKKHIKAQVIWVTAEQIDWEAKTMTAKSIVDGLEYFDVLLGLGSFYRKPKLGTKCIISLLENKEGTVLIDALEFEEAVFTSDESQFTIKEDGFIVKVGNESLKDILNDWQEQFGKLTDEINKIVVSIGVTPNVPQITIIKTKVTTTLKNRLNTILVE